MVVYFYIKGGEKMQGSQYTDEFRENALALCAMPKKTITQVAKELGMPRATLYDWVKSAKASDPDYVAVRRNKIRNMMDKAYSIAARSIESLERQSKALKFNNQKLDQVISKLEDDERLDEQTIEKIKEIIKNYTDISMIDTMKVLKESLAISEKFENALSGEKNNSDTNIKIYFADE